MPTYQPNITEPFIYTNFLNIMRSVAFQTLNIYVNSVTGQDAGPGRGSSPTSAYKTLKAALTNAFVLSNEAQVVLHLAGADPFSVPDGMTFPQLSSPDQITLNPTPTFGFNKRAPLVIRATPTLFTTIAALNVVSQANNAFSGMKEITTTGGLVVNALQGKWLQDANGVLARVSSNAAAVINIDYSGVDLTAPFLIYDEGATITPADPLSGNPTVNLRGGTTPIVFFGVAIVASAGGAVQVGPGQQAAFIACDIPSLSAGSSNNSNLSLPAAVECVACDLSSLSLPAANLTVSKSRFADGTFTNMSHQSRIVAEQCSFESMVSRVFSDGSSSPQQQTMINCIFAGSGVQAINGRLDMQVCDVADTPAEGVFGLRYATLKLTGVTSSTLNAGVGLYLQNGSVAEVDPTTDILSVGNAIQLGASGPTFATFAAFRTGASPYSSMATGEGSSVWEGAQGQGGSGPPGSLGNVVVVTTTPYVVQPTDGYILVDASLGVITIELPALAGSQARELAIKKIDNSVNNVIIDGDLAENIDGFPTKSLGVQYQSYSLVGGPSEWSII